MAQKEMFGGCIIPVLILILALASAVCGTSWIATWQPNAEDDLSGYILTVEDGADTSNYSVGLVTRYEFSAGDDICAYLRAVDKAGNFSEKSLTTCVKADWTPGAPGLVFCDTLEIQLPPVVVTVHDTLRLWYPVEVPVPYAVHDTLTVIEMDTIYQVVQDDDTIEIKVFNSFQAKPGVQSFQWKDSFDNVAPDGERTKINLFGITNVNVDKEVMNFWEKYCPYFGLINFLTAIGVLILLLRKNKDE